MNSNKFKEDKIFKNKNGEWRSGSLHLWGCYDSYISLCKDLDERSLNVWQYPKWYRHYSYMLYLKKKLNSSFKNQEGYSTE